MDLPTYLQHLYDYHSWANAHALAAAERLTEEQLNRPQGHSFGSVLGTLRHMHAAEWIWWRRWQGESPKAFPDPAETPTLAALRARWQAQAAEMRAFLAAQTPESVEREIAYTNTRGESYRLRLWQMAAHVANHGTHHRAELAAMYALLDVPHAEEDWSRYFLEQTGQR